jgi:hypothetical protein
MKAHSTLYSWTLSSGTLMDSTLILELTSRKGGTLQPLHVCRKHPYPVQSAFLTDYVPCRYEHINSEKANSGTAMLTLDNIFSCRVILRIADTVPTASHFHRWPSEVWITGCETMVHLWKSSCCPTYKVVTVTEVWTGCTFLTRRIPSTQKPTATTIKNLEEYILQILFHYKRSNTLPQFL